MTRVVRKETLVNQVIVGRISDLEILKSWISIDQAYIELLHYTSIVASVELLLRLNETAFLYLFLGSTFMSLMMIGQECIDPLGKLIN